MCLRIGPQIHSDFSESRVCTHGVCVYCALLMSVPEQIFKIKRFSGGLPFCNVGLCSSGQKSQMLFLESPRAILPVLGSQISWCPMYVPESYTLLLCIVPCLGQLCTTYARGLIGCGRPWPILILCCHD